MATKKFNELTTSTTFNNTDFIVGYANTSPGGERRWPYSAIRNEITQYLPLSGGTLTNDLSVNGVLSDSIGNSNNWNQAYDIGTAYSLVSSTFLTSESDSQTLTFDEITKELTISNGNTVPLGILQSVPPEILPTVTNYLSTQNVLVSSLTITNNLSVVGGINLNSGGTPILYVGFDKIGINTEFPNHELTVIGDISATGDFWTAGRLLSAGVDVSSIILSAIATPVITNTTNSTLALSDASSIKRLDTSAGNMDVIIPLNASVPFNIGTQLILANVSSNVATISATSGVTLLSKDSKYKLSSQGSVASLFKTASNEWIVVGDLTT